MVNSQRIIIIFRSWRKLIYKNTQVKLIDLRKGANAPSTSEKKKKKTKRKEKEKNNNRKINKKKKRKINQTRGVQ